MCLERWCLRLLGSAGPRASARWRANSVSTEQVGTAGARAPPRSWSTAPCGVTYTDDTREPIRVAELDGVRLLITGSGKDDDFRKLAALATGAEILP